MFKPHVTVACLVQAEGELLVVEERINGRATWNQPAGHLEANETLLAAAQRELVEETGINAPMQYFLGVQQWIAPDNTSFVRFLFGLDLAKKLPTAPQDSDIDCCWWLPPAQILSAPVLRSPLVAESVRLWQQGARYPLHLISPFNWPFHEGARHADA
ncbi:NUDIX domain-containing protein [Mixta mediterraneensis]|uniref:NUDIX domain-containing protein n=1 Tax=Mixta mediterraneensis TaxID=2758443 RepID=UPI00187570B0|nr:NUDIX hydrolase [Mixta mediterraneensis]MBE5252966.1 NUDIX hydrolase [Mixta mediterraneensis]